MDKKDLIWFYTNRSNPALGEVQMTGTLWTTIDNSIPLNDALLEPFTLVDPDRLFDQLCRPPDKSGMSQLVLCRGIELYVPPGGETDEMFAKAKLTSLSQPFPQTALRILAQQPNIFTTTFIDDVPVTSCLVGVVPIISPSGRKYILELGNFERDQPFLRFRRIDGVQWSGDELWAFEK